MNRFRTAIALRRATSVSVGLVTVLTVGISGSAAAYAAAPVGGNSVANANSTQGSVWVTPDGWVHYDSVLGKTGAAGRTTTITGKRDGSGACVFSGSGTAPSGIPGPSYTEEVAYNPATCKSTIVTANVTATQLSQISSLTGSTTTTATTTANATPSTKGALATGRVAASAAYSRYVKSSWIDPINITISTQTVGLKWTSTNWTSMKATRDSFKGCVRGVCLDQTYIVSRSQWAAPAPGGWQAVGLVHFRNTSFAKWVVGILGPTGWAACGFPKNPRADFHHTDNVTGLKNGGATWNWDDTKSGACTNLVHHGATTDVY